MKDPTQFADFREAWPDVNGDLLRVTTTYKFDREQYIKNLIDTRRVLDANGIPCLLAFGTLLGAIRDGGPCDGDQDVDLLTTGDHEPKLVKLFLEHDAMSGGFRDAGFQIIRVSNNILTVARDGPLGPSYVDVYIFRKVPGAGGNDIYSCAGSYTIDAWRIENPWTMPLHGLVWNIPGQPEGYLARVYPNWRVPQNYHART